MSKYLDLNGLSTLWGKIKAKFATKDELDSGLSSKQNALGINPNTGSANKFLNQQGQFATVETDLSAYAKKADIPTTLPASDVKAWAKADTKPTYTKGEIGLGNVDNTADSAKDVLHAKSADNATKVNNHTVNADVPSGAKFTDTEYVVPTLPSAPTSSTLTFTDNGAIRSFKVGYMCRVADSSAEHGYKFYQLYNISNGEATWGEISGGGGDYDETVTVKLISTASSSDSKLNGVVVTVKNTTSGETQTQTWKGTPLVFKIPAVNTYTVSSSSVSGYVPPAKQSYTAGVGTSRTVTIPYIYIPVGIYIYDTDGNFTQADDWNTSNNGKAVGVSVVTENSAFVISPTCDSRKYQWGGYGTTISGIVTTDDTVTAKKDYAGKSNTDKIIAKLGTGKAPAAEYCRNYTFKNGKKGYLLSLGEALDAYNNQAAINAAMSKIGGTAIVTEDYYFTSTQYSSGYAWELNWNYGFTSYESKNNYLNVRAVCAF